MVVPFSGTDEELASCLEALAAVRLRDGDELLVADNRLRPRPRAVGRLEVIDAAGPASSYFARAVAARRARGEWLVFVDADCLPEPDLLDAYLDPAPGERVGALAGTIEDWAADDTRVSRYVSRRAMLDQGRTLEHPRPYGVTANLAVRRSAFEAVGGWPEPVRSGGDADLCWRLAEAGWTLQARPAARVRHRNVAGLASLLRRLHRVGAGMQWLDQRWPGAFPPPRPRELVGRMRLLTGGADGALDLLCLWARDLGRLRANGDPAGVRPSAP